MPGRLLERAYPHNGRSFSETTSEGRLDDRTPRLPHYQRAARLDELESFGRLRCPVSTTD